MLNNILLQGGSKPYNAENGLYFDGVNDGVELQNSFLDLLNQNIQVNKKFTFSLWLKIKSTYSSTNGQGTVLCVLNNTSFDGYSTVGCSIGSYSPNTILMVLVNYGIGLTEVNITKNLSVGIHHFCFVFESISKQSIYIDGVLENSNIYTIGTVGTINYSGLSKYIGLYLSSLFNQKGDIHDLKIFKDSLTPQEIYALYNKRIPNRAMSKLVFNMPFESLYKTGLDVYTPELVSANDGQLIGYPAGAKGIVDANGNDIQLVP